MSESHKIECKKSDSNGHMLHKSVLVLLGLLKQSAID